MTLKPMASLQVGAAREEDVVEVGAEVVVVPPVARRPALGDCKVLGLGHHVGLGEVWQRVGRWGADGVKGRTRLEQSTAVYLYTEIKQNDEINLTR